MPFPIRKEFLPRSPVNSSANDGSFLYSIIFTDALNFFSKAVNTSTDMGAAPQMQKRSERVLARFPEIELVFGRLGTPESATDPMGVHLADTFLVLQKDHSKWPLVNGRKRTKAELYEAMKEAIEKEVMNKGKSTDEISIGGSSEDDDLVTE